MKLIALFCCLGLTITPPVQAQQTAPSKEIVIVDFFSRIREVPAPYTEMLRGHVLGAFAERGRLNIIDAEASRMLTATVPGSGITTPMNAPADMDAFLQFRAPQALEAGARYLVSGTIVGYKFEHTTLPPVSSGKPPRQGFKSSFRVVIAALDLKTGERMADAPYELSATAPIAEDADMAALARIRMSMSFYVDYRFKFETQILELCPPDKKGRIRELFIHSGSDMGVVNGDLFLVYEEVPIGGVMTRQKVGKLRVNDVENPDVARCKITKGGDEIARALAAGRGLVCISDGKALF